MDDILSGLNERQLQAVTAPAGPALVLAGPGSGKTHIIAHRAAWLVSAQGALPQQVLCVTFTNRAAQEMQVRLEELIGEPARAIWVYTFHALATRLLRRNAAAIGLSPHFVVADENMQTEVITQAVRRQSLSLEAYPAYRLIDFISQYKRNLQDPAHANPEEVGEDLVAIATAYQAGLGARGLLDFDDLIGQAVRLLAQDRRVRERVQRVLPHILVDEYQDINRAQFALLKLLAPPGHDVMAVADAAQSIYGWRGAQPGLITAYREHYSPAVVELEQSYRSTQTILFSAEGLIQHNNPAYGERGGLRTEQGPGAPIYHYLLANGKQEQQWLVQLIQKLVSERGYQYRDIAILYRTHQLADEMEGALLQAHIPIERVRRESFFEEPAVREVVRYLHLIHSLATAGPATSAEPMFTGAFNFPQTLADEFTLLQLSRLAATHNLPLAELARRAADFPELSPLTRADLEGFVRLLDEHAGPEVEESAAAALTAAFEIMTQRRSPFSPEEERLLRAAAAFLGFPQAAPALRDHLALHGRAALAAPATVDGVCAAVILKQAAARYLGYELDLTLVPPGSARGFQITLDPEKPPLTLAPRHGSLEYSLSTMAWRLAQELLVAHETSASGPLVVYDLETTGIDVRRDEIVEIAAQRLEGLTQSGSPFYSLVRPSRGIPLAASRIHGLYPEDLRDAEGIDAVLPRFLRYAGSQTVVGHNVKRFDNRFIDRETGRLYGRGFPNPSVDTLEMAARLYGDDPDMPIGLGLGALLAHFRLADKLEHRAGADVEQTIRLLRHLLRESALQRGLNALPEYLPLVAAGMFAAGAPQGDENSALWQGGLRMLARLGAATGLAEAAALLPAAEAQQLRQIVADMRGAPALPEERAWTALQERFAAQIETFSRFSDDTSLAAFLDYEALATGADTTQNAERPNRVTLMTLHNAKGTEYPVVIIIGVEEDNLPLWTTLDDEGQVQEERRVFYVGLTRAQRQLYLTSVRQRGDGFVRAPSRFVYELPPEHVRRYEIGPQGEVVEVS